MKAVAIAVASQKVDFIMQVLKDFAAKSYPCLPK
jgi:hypothetical protein